MNTLSEIKPNVPNIVKTDTCPGKFRKVLKIITYTSLYFYDFKWYIITIRTLDSAVFTDCFYCIVVEEIKIFFNKKNSQFNGIKKKN